MPRTGIEAVPPLTDAAIRRVHNPQKQIKLSDEKGLYLLLHPNGGKYWRLKYRLHGRERLLALGVYPDVSLAKAREKRDAARSLVADGQDPNEAKRTERSANATTFKATAQEWLQLQGKRLAPKTVQMLSTRLATYVYPTLGGKPVAKVSAQDLLSALKGIEKRGKHETAHRVRALAGRVLRYAVASGRATHDVAADLKGALAPVTTTNFASITDPKRVGELMRAIDGYGGQPSTEYALRIAPYVFVRPGELRAAEWSEFHIEGDRPEWRIPATRMKMGVLHIVPLSRQVVALLRGLRAIVVGGPLLFPGLRSPARPISENTLNAALRRLGYSREEMTGHGFRSMASTLLNEQGFAPDCIELQLAHQESNKVRGAYNRAQRLPERREMMQRWADYLDLLKLAENGAHGS